MMVTITSMKKLQEPDLLLDQPHYNFNSHRFTNNLNKNHRSNTRHSPKTRKAPLKNPDEYPSPTSTISTSVSSSSPFEENKPTVGVASNNHVVVDGLDENTRWSTSSRNHPHHNHNNNPLPSNAWIRTKASSTSSMSSGDEWRAHKCLVLTNCSKMSRKHLIVLFIISLILITSLVTFLALLLRPSMSESSLASDTRPITTSSGSDSVISSDININPVDESLEEGDGGDESYDYEQPESSSNNNNNNLDLKEVSRLSWNLLNSNQEKVSIKDTSKPHRNHHTSSPSNLVPSSLSGMRGGEEVILPAKMIFTSTGDLGKSTNLTPNSSGENSSSNNNKKRSCCRTQKYSQVIKRDGCEPLTIPNRMCFGQCVSVWVPGLFASFPVCRPSRSSWKTVTLTCGRNRDRKRRVRIEKVRRCSCMEIEPTASASPSITRR